MGKTTTNHPFSQPRPGTELSPTALFVRDKQRWADP